MGTDVAPKDQPSPLEEIADQIAERLCLEHGVQLGCFCAHAYSEILAALHAAESRGGRTGTAGSGK
jgi:hypothetical protein